METLSFHNLITYKSKHEVLNAWALEESIGHYVNYRKVTWMRRTKVGDIHLYAVSTRRSVSILSQTGAMEIKPGVWDLWILSRKIRILILSELSLVQQNAILAFFSFNEENVDFARNHYQWKRGDGTTVVNQLLEQYSMEGMNMPYTREFISQGSRPDILLESISER